MNYVAFFFIFFLVWWMVFYMALSVGVKTPDTVEKGYAASAPVQPNIKKKMIATTVIALVLTALLFVVFHYDLIDTRFITNPK